MTLTPKSFPRRCAAFLWVLLRKLGTFLIKLGKLLSFFFQKMPNFLSKTHKNVAHRRGKESALGVIKIVGRSIPDLSTGICYCFFAKPLSRVSFCEWLKLLRRKCDSTLFKMVPTTIPAPCRLCLRESCEGHRARLPVRVCPRGHLVGFCKVKQFGKLLVSLFYCIREGFRLFRNHPTKTSKSEKSPTGYNRIKCKSNNGPFCSILLSVSGCVSPPHPL